MAELTAVGLGLLGWFLSSLFKDTKWNDRMKVILMLIISLVIATIAYFCNLYPDFWVVLQKILFWTGTTFVALAKFVGFDWKQK